MDPPPIKLRGGSFQFNHFLNLIESIFNFLTTTTLHINSAPGLPVAPPYLIGPTSSASIIWTTGDRPRFNSSRISPAFFINLSAVFLELPQTPHFMQVWLVTFMDPDVLLWLSWPQSFFWYASLHMTIPTTAADREIVEALWNHFRGNGPLTYCLYCRDFDVLLSIEESKGIIDNNNIRVRVNKKWEVDCWTCV